MRSTWISVLLCACAAAPAPTLDPRSPDRARLRARPEVGAEYVTHHEVRFELYGRRIRARRVLRTTVVAVDRGEVVLSHRVIGGGLDRIDPRLVLPPATDPLTGAILEERRDPRGRRVAALTVTEGTEEQRAEIAASAIHPIVGAPSLPREAVGPESRWIDAGRWAFRIGASAPIEGEREMTYAVASFGPRSVTITMRGESRREGDSVTVEGRMTIEREDALVASGELEGTTDEGEDGEISRYAIWWSTERADQATVTFEDDATDAPRSRVFDGEACEARVAALSRRIDAAPTGMPVATELAVPTVERGRDVPAGPLVELTADAARVDQRGGGLARVIADLETYERNIQILRPGHEGPLDVLVAVPADLPVARLRELTSRLASDRYALHLLVRLADPPALPAVVVEGVPEAVGALAVELEVPELVSLAVGTCTPLIEAWGQLANVPDALRRARLRASVPPALRTCACRGVDVDLLDAALMRIAVDGLDPALRVVPVPEPPRRGGATVGSLL